MKRLAAVVVAVAMIAGAWLLRTNLDEDSIGRGDAPSDGFRLRCATGLADVCAALADADAGIDVAVEDPGTTSDALVGLPAGKDPGFDAWLVDGPWAAVTADNRLFRGIGGEVLGEPGAVLARSPAVLAMNDAAWARLDSTCGGTITWTCVGEQPGGLSIGLPTPERGDGLVVLAGATASYFGTTDYSSTDFDEPGFTGWFDRLTDLSRSTSLGDQTPLERALVAPGTFGVVGALESETATLLRDRGNWRAIYPEPMTTADVQLVPRVGLDADRALDRLDAERVRAALADEGWRIEGQAPPGAVDAPGLPPTPDLPGPGVLQTLRSMW